MDSECHTWTDCTQPGNRTPLIIRQMHPHNSLLKVEQGIVDTSNSKPISNPIQVLLLTHSATINGTKEPGSNFFNIILQKSKTLVNHHHKSISYQIQHWQFAYSRFKNRLTVDNKSIQQEWIFVLFLPSIKIGGSWSSQHCQ